MNFAGIALYTFRAAAFALAVCAVYALVMRARKKALRAGQILSVFYLAALIEITVLRGGVEWTGFFSAPREAFQWVPLRTTLGQLRLGAWPFVYHVVGNLIWFVPLGFVVQKKPVWAALVAGALLSAAIEGLQWALMTGMPDVDDVLLNAAGALVGRLAVGPAVRLWTRRSASR